MKVEFKKFYRKPFVEAFQWFEDMGEIEDIVYKVNSLYCVELASKEFIVINNGDWIVKGEDGLYLCRNWFFKALYGEKQYEK